MAYIDAEKLKSNIRVNLMPNVDIDGTVTVENAERYFLNLIDKTSTADVAEVKHGQWIIDTSIKARGFYEVNYKVLITCSICGNRHCLGEQPYPTFTQEELKTDTYRKYRYCGECGARMDGRSDINEVSSQKDS